MLPSDASAIVVGTSTQRPVVLTSPAGPGHVETSSATVGPAFTPPTPAVTPPTPTVTPPTLTVTLPTLLPLCEVTTESGTRRLLCTGTSTTHSGGDGITIPGMYSRSPHILHPAGLQAARHATQRDEYSTSPAISLLASARNGMRYAEPNTL